MATPRTPSISSKKTGIVDAFKVYGAALANRRWAMSAIAEDGSLVVSCWETYFQKGMRYLDALSRWGDGNAVGRELLRGHIEQAMRDNLPIRLVIAHRASGGSRPAQYFHVRPDLVGRVTQFDGDSFTIEFARA